MIFCRSTKLSLALEAFLLYYIKYEYQRSFENSAEHRRTQTNLQRQRACLLHPERRVVQFDFTCSRSGRSPRIYDFYAFESDNARGIRNGGTFVRAHRDRVQCIGNIPRRIGHEKETDVENA